MPLFGGKNNKFKVDPPKIRVEKVTVSRPAPKPAAAATTRRPLANGSASSSARASPRPSPKPSSASSSRQKSNSPYPPSSSDERRGGAVDRKRKASSRSSATPRRSPAAVERVEFDKDSDADEEDDGWLTLETRKRQRTGTLDGRSEDHTRKLRNSASFEGRHERLEFIHAVQVASLDCKCVPVMGAQKEDVSFDLQYPSLGPRER